MKERDFSGYALACLLVVLWWAMGQLAFGDITSNLAAHYKFDGDGNDSSGNGRNLTLTGTMPYVTGKIGQGCTPTGTNKFTLANPSWLSSLSAYTVAFWCKDAGYNINEAAVSYGTNANTGSIVLYPFDTSNGNGFKAFANNVGNVLDLNTSKPATGSWQHVCIVVSSSSDAKLYVNGALEQTNTTNSMATAASLTHISVGTYANAAQPYSGDIDELRFYTRAISSGDVTELYNYAGRLPIAPSYLNSLVQ